MIDLIRAIDNRRMTTKGGDLPRDIQHKVKENLRIVLGLDF